MNGLDARMRDELLGAGLANQRSGRFAEAEQCYRLVLSQNPREPEALYRMGVLALQCGNAAGAVHYLRQAAAVRAFDADAWYNFGMAHAFEYDFDPALAAFERSLALDPEHPSAAVSLGNMHKLMGRAREARVAYLAAVDSPRTDAVLFSQLLIGLHTNPTIDAATLFELHREWARRYAASLYPVDPRFDNDPDPGRRLVIGLVSPKFTADIVGHFLRPVVPSLAERADLVLYDCGGRGDWLTEELKRAPVAWRDISRLSDEAAARAIAGDRIDVLVDLAGHVPGNRLRLFARRPAPVQVTWLDYFDTTGVDVIDVLITDAVTTPAAVLEDGAQRFVERLGYLPHSRLCYGAPPFAPAVTPAPVLANGHVTFGCFGRADKIGGEVVALWSRVLCAVPTAKLLLKNSGLEVGPVRERLLREFEAHGVARERIVLRGASPHAALLAEYGDVDIALDTFPYNGGATTCDALWMGVPVVTLAGEAMIARQGASLLAAAGCAQWVANDDVRYTGIACELARDAGVLARTREGLRARVAGSPLCDGDAFGRDLLGVLTDAWQAWCASGRKRARSHAPSAASAPCAEAGVSLLELLIVLMLMALVAAMAMPMFGGGVSTTQLKSAAREIAAGLRLARSEAVAARRETVLTLDLAQRTFKVDRDPRPHALPRDVELKLYTAQSDLVSETVGAVRFFPDGGSTGGRVTVAAGERKFDIDVDWLTGRVAIAQ